jgi:drug/metabolite transporter (DMT)-like permease
MLISSVCAICGIVVFQLDGHGNLKLYPTEAAAALTILLSVCFCAGFVTLNASLGVLHVSSVMTMRAAEPVATYLLGLLLVPNEKTSFQALICLVPIVLGAGLSAVAKTPETDEISVSGLMLVLVCNICFALRTIITKILKTRHSDMDNYNLFLQLCLLGCLWQGVFVLLSGLEGFQSIANIPMLLLNGLTFYLYLQLSWVVMGMVDSVTHSVCNSLRRPVICAAGWIAFGGITVQGVAGVLTATAGTLLYARAKQRSALRLQQ